MTTLRDYHRMGRAADPRDAVLSASQLIKGFNPHPRSGAHPAATLAAITGEPTAPTFDMMAGTFLHLMLLDGLEPVRVDPKLATWTATGLGKGGNLDREVSIEGTCRLGSYLIGPPALLPSNALAGNEQRRALLQLAGELDLELAGCPSGPVDTEQMTAARRAYDEALATAAWLIENPPPLPGALSRTVCDACGCAESDDEGLCRRCQSGRWIADPSPGLPPSAQRARYLLCEAPGQVEQDFFGQWGEIRTRARPDKVIQPALINLKRTWKAHPSNFWWEYELRGWGIAEAFYEAVMGGDAMCEDCDGAVREFEFTTMGSDNMDIDGWIEPCGNPECIGGRVPGIALRPWTFGAIAPATKTAPPQAFVYPVSEERQEVARRQLDDMMLRYQECLETGQWWADEEMHAEQPCPPPGVNRAWHEDDVS